jgi:phospholipid/cholesterol/gamma-HCH transport system ATP-binding protein
MHPSVLFIGEPLAGLDPVVAAELDRLILRVRDALRVSIVVVMHEIESGFAIADPITVLDCVRTLMMGSVEEAKNSENQQARNLHTRTSEEPPIGAEEYLCRLTGGVR